MAEIVRQKEHKDEQGETKAKGSYTLSKEDGAFTVNVNFSVKKTGIAGTGKGFMTYAIYDRDKNEVYRYDKGFTVGADLSGAAKKDDSEEAEIMGWDGKGKTIFKVAATADSSGLPDSIDDITDFIGFDLLGDFGAIKEIGGWIIESID
ncbi:Protein of unknown function [Bacillus toyonensis]|uniref:hypothetical protein n=1 Tax=Bacillus toyonensis TaxID=155322 RepID=UPI0008643C32|nr:hypothetical protein [Bacillus toyonensis]SCN20235.1 Protein of unknown function [Bacillus toyonensis]